MTNGRARSTKLLVVALAPAAWIACGGAEPQSDAPTGFPDDLLVDAAWIEAHADDPSVRLVEIGADGDAYAEGHIPGAVFVAQGQLTNPDDPIGAQIGTGAQISTVLSGAAVGRDQTVVLYDRHSNRLAARAFWVLKYYGHPEARLFDGGAAQWTAAGHEFSTDTPVLEPTMYQTGPADPEIRTTWQYVIDHTDDPSTLTCDVRSADEHAGLDVRAERGGHIPGSLNVEWTEAVAPDGTFKSFEELSAIYASAGFRRDMEIITYCQSGVRASHTWFVLKELLGYPSVRIYDGSWLEYGNDPDSPISE